MNAPDVLINIGSFAAGIVASFAGFVFQEWAKDRRLRRSIATALLAEAEAALLMYMTLIGQHIQDTPETELPVRRVTYREYATFPIFEALSRELGVFPQQDAQILARSYTTATSYVQTLRNLFLSLGALDQLNIQVAQAGLVGNDAAHRALTMERDIKQQGLLEFWGEVRRQHFYIAETLYQDLCVALGRYCRSAANLF